MESNVVEMIEPAPEGFNISREAWAKTPEATRSEIIRMDREMSEGLAILKDRRAGRAKRIPGQPGDGKRVPGGWWELWKQERDGNVARVAELRDLLAPEAAHMAQKDAENEAIEAIFKHAQATGIGEGMSLPEYLERMVGLESWTRKHPYSGIAQILKSIGIDPIDYATVIAAGAHLAHGMFLKIAARTIRNEPNRNWDGYHFGFMADEVERVRPDCVVMQPNGYRAVDYGRLADTPEARSLPVYSYRYRDGVQFLDSPEYAA